MTPIQTRIITLGRKTANGINISEMCLLRFRQQRTAVFRLPLHRPCETPSPNNFACAKLPTNELASLRDFYAG